MDPSPFTGPEWEPGAIVLAVLSLAAVIVAIPPFCWHVRHRNLAAASLIVWPIILCSINFVNSLIWHNDDTANWWPGYVLCDIESKIIVGSYAGFNCALATIARSLANVLDTRRITVESNKKRRRRDMWIQLVMCWGCPLYLMFAHFIVQPYRYYVWGIAGCTPAFDNSWLSIILIFVWSVVFSIISVVYAGILIYRLHRYRHEFHHMLRVNRTSKSRFMRLFALSLILILCFLPLAVYVFYTNLAFPRHDFSWHDVHEGTWSQIFYVESKGAVVYDLWFRIAAAFLSFFFFGLGEDAITMYKRWMAKLGLGKWFPSINDRRPSNATIDSGPLHSRHRQPETQSKEHWYNKLFWRSKKARQSLLPLQSAQRTSLSSIHTATNATAERKYSADPVTSKLQAELPPRAIDALKDGRVVVRHEMWEETGSASPERSLF